uniref:Phosphatidylinositol-glycan biosynthesis class F protein n=1 Tax=Anguilla anguilla TaxID=7936 RepID=A0A0E9V4D5_ANGAN
MSIWDTSLQITTACTVIGTWVELSPSLWTGTDPWQVWPISCSLGATFGFLTGLIIAPGWIYWHRKQLTYKCK